MLVLVIFGQVGKVVLSQLCASHCLETFLNFCLSGGRQLGLHEKTITCRSKSQFLSNVQTFFFIRQDICQNCPLLSHIKTTYSLRDDKGK